MRLFKGILTAALLSVAFSAQAQLDMPSMPSMPNMLGDKPMMPNMPKSLTDNNKTLTQNGKMLQEVSEEDEIRMGRESAAVLLGARPLVPDARIQRYVNTLGRWLAMQSERPDLPWTFAVIDDNSFNAFSVPGGYVFITRGLLARMHNESELAGVLGHEIGHVLRKHVLKAMQTTQALTLTGGNNAGLGKPMVDPKLQKQVSNMVTSYWINGLGQDDEFEADRIGIVIAARAGFDPYGLPAVLQALEMQSTSESDFAMLFKSHPRPGDRLNRLEQVIASRFDKTQGSVGKTIEERLREF